MDVNWAFLTPSVARLLDPIMTPSLKTLVLGGELVTHADWEKWNGHLPTNKRLRASRVLRLLLHVFRHTRPWFSIREDWQARCICQLGGGSQEPQQAGAYRIDR